MRNFSPVTTTLELTKILDASEVTHRQQSDEGTTKCRACLDKTLLCPTCPGVCHVTVSLLAPCLSRALRRACDILLVHSHDSTGIVQPPAPKQHSEIQIEGASGGA
eukprot:c18225_g1_i1.p1 GENE.c18225_g1_i1~~c18225_g1_i1.p1  ORF type:complete len:106 (+),score=13.20 c18225_g1_i1:524-841(+)